MRGRPSLYLYCLTFLVFGSCKESPRCTKGGKPCRRDLVGPTLLQVRGKLRQGQGKVQLLENHDGNCLEASNMAHNGAGPSMEVCDGQNDLQHWRYDETSGLLMHIGGKCLDASQRDIPNGRIHLWDCDASNKNQMWDWLPETQQFKNRYGLCMDAPHPQRPGSHIHMWTCREDLSNQRWVFHDIDVAITTTTETSTETPTTSTSTTSTTSTEATATTSTSEVTTSSSSTSTTTPQPLSAVRNCQLEPLVEGSGCKRVAVFEADIFGLGENGQETEGRHRCLEKLREEPAAESFVHAIGRCELWHCVTYARLKMSAGPGGGLSSSPNAIALVDRHQRYVTALEDGGHMEAVEGSFVPEALFYLEEVKAGRFTLKAASNQLFLKAIPGGRLVAETQQWDDWELFELEKTEDKVALKSFHYSYVTVDDAGHVSAGSWERTADTDFTLVNRSLAAWEEEHGALAQRGMLKTFSSSMDHVICQWPSSTANVRCCGDDSKVVLEESYGCFEYQTFAEAGEICKQHGLSLCSLDTLKSCEGCSTCGLKGLTWTSSPCSAAESLAQRRLNQRNDRAGVFSTLCPYEAKLGGLHGEELRSSVFVKLMEWNYNDIAQECTDYLAPNGFEAVQVAPVTEHVLGYQWWVKYQPVSAGLDTRSGTEEEFRRMVATCRSVGVQVIVDILMNHMASPCRNARKPLQPGDDLVPCVGWGGSKYGNRRQEGARGWDASQPEHFHHLRNDSNQPFCKVGPQTGWLCPDDDCTPCDMYELPDYNTELQEVRDMQFKHLEELFHIGVTGLRVDAAIYHHVYELADMLNRLPWDLIYQEWWGEYPPEERTKYVGLYRDVAYRWHVVNRISNKNATDFPELLNLTGGVFGINADMAVYPFAYHDGRSTNADPEIATYKNGLAFHQQQKFFLSWPVGNSVLIWGGYGWRDLNHGPPGCDKADGDHCTPHAVYDNGTPQCMDAPTESPLPRTVARERRWICEHRWQGVAGMVHFRKVCRGHAVTQTWRGGLNDGIALGRLAFRLGDACFVAMVRGRRKDEDPTDPEVVGVGGPWKLDGLHIGLPAGCYCDLSSLLTQKGWDGETCPRSVQVNEDGMVASGQVAQGEILAIHVGARHLKLSE
mgnify:FL=1